VTDPVLIFVLVFSFFVLLALVSWFKRLDFALWRERAPLIAGIVAGVALRFIDVGPRLYVVLVGVILTLAALYVRLTGRESEPADGMILGAIMGGAASLPMVLDDQAMLRFSQCILTGAVAGYGITFGVTHVRDKVRQLGIDVITAILAIAAAALPLLARKAGATDRQIAITSAVLIPLVVVLTVFKQWSSIRSQLRHEAALGVIDDEDVRPTAHPLRRLGRAGWHDAGAHREFVRIANQIALRKLQQRGRPDSIARLYQLEVIKLRMELQEMTSVDRAMRAAEHGGAGTIQT
jgi:hypothetical protein